MRTYFAKKITNAYIDLKFHYNKQQKYRDAAVQLKLTIQKLLSVAFYLFKTSNERTETHELRLEYRKLRINVFKQPHGNNIKFSRNSSSYS